MRWPATRAAPLSPLWQWFALGRAHLSTPCGRRGGVALLTALQRGDNLFHPLPLRVQILQRLIEVHVPPPFLDRTYHHRSAPAECPAEPFDGLDPRSSRGAVARWRLDIPQYR